MGGAGETAKEVGWWPSCVDLCERLGVTATGTTQAKRSGVETYLKYRESAGTLLSACTAALMKHLQHKPNTQPCVRYTVHTTTRTADAK